MARYIRIEDNIIVEELETNEDIATLYHPSVKWAVCTDSQAIIGYSLVDNKWVSPEACAVPITKEKAEEARLCAYAHPISGSDRYFAEALALQSEGFAATSIEVKEAKALGVARKLEIKASHPYPSVN